MQKKKQKRKFKVGDVLIRTIDLDWPGNDRPYYREGTIIKIKAITAARYHYDYLGYPEHPNGIASFPEIENGCKKAGKLARVLYGNRKT